MYRFYSEHSLIIVNTGHFFYLFSDHKKRYLYMNKICYYTVKMLIWKIILGDWIPYRVVRSWKRNQILWDFQWQICGKTADFAGNFRDKFCLKGMVENGWFYGNFLATFPQKVIGFALIWQMLLTKKEGNLPVFVTNNYCKFAASKQPLQPR